MANTLDDDIDDLRPMSVQTRSDPVHDENVKEIIPEETVNHIYAFFFTTNGFIIAVILIWFALLCQYAAGKSGIIISATNRLFQFNNVINSNKPANLRELIRHTSLEAMRTKAIRSIPIDRYETVEDNGMQVC
jgi:hypothetical protein